MCNNLFVGDTARTWTIELSSEAVYFEIMIRELWLLSSGFIIFLYVASVLANKDSWIIPHLCDYEPHNTNRGIRWTFQWKFNDREQLPLTVVDQHCMESYLYALQLHDVYFFLYNEVENVCESFIVMLSVSYVLYIPYFSVHVPSSASWWHHNENSYTGENLEFT